MTPERRREVDRLFRAVCGRLINSVLAHGRSASGELSDHSVFEKSADLSVDPTLTDTARAASLQFQPGMIVVQRYRIVHLLGRGGMSEVYRADDLLLGQAVALNFMGQFANTLQ
jgi:hypothetical protein